MRRRRRYFDFLKLLWVKASSTKGYIGVLELSVVEQDMLVAFGDPSTAIRQVSCHTHIHTNDRVRTRTHTDHSIHPTAT